jgi:hypothetical protein
MGRLGKPGAVHACTSDLALFIRGRLSGPRADSICEHLLACHACQEEAQDITALLWPSLSIWIKCWLHLFSPSAPTSRLLRFCNRTGLRMWQSFPVR